MDASIGMVYFISVDSQVGIAKDRGLGYFG